MNQYVITHSDISLYLRCKRSWLWSYIYDRNAPELPIGALALGSRVHVACEALYKAAMAGTQIDAVAYYQLLCAAEIEKCEKSDAPGYVLDQLYEDIIIGRNCVEAYVQWLTTSGANHGYLVDGVECKIEAPFLDGRVLLRSKIDLRLRREVDMALVLIDLKTTGLHFGSLRDQLEKSYQLRMYRVVQLLMQPEDRVAAIGYDMIKKVTRKQKGSNMVERFFVPGILHGERAIITHLEGVCSDMIRDIERVVGGEDSDRVCYPVPGESCKWCEYKHPCMIADENPPAAIELLNDKFPPGRHARYEDIDPGEA